MDWLSWGVYVLSGKWAFAKAVCEAHRDYRKAKPSLDAKRTHINPQSSPTTIYKGWIVWQRLVGKKRFEQLRMRR